MTCAEIEILLADYIDGTLPAVQKSALEQHLDGCRLCAEFARDCGAAVAFVERVAEVEPPPELVTKLIFEATQGPGRASTRPSLLVRLLGGWAEPVLQPRFAMGMAMTMLSLAMLFRFLGLPERQLTPADLNPVQVWAATEDRASRVWDRGVKYYESLRFVYEIQTQLQEWDVQAGKQDSAVSPSKAVEGAQK